MKVLSLFDGISCGQVALERAGIEVETYYASEIDDHAISVTQRNHPDTIQLGDVLNWREWDIGDVDLVMGGSPCQGFSLAGRRLNFDDPRSRLFFEFVAIVEHFKPTWFLLENVRMRQDIQDAISRELGVQPILINSGLVSAQSRERLYWCNIPNLSQPDDRAINLKDILETNPTDVNHRPLERYFNGHENRLTDNGLCHIGTADLNGMESIKRVYHPNGKSPTLTTNGGGNRETKIATSKTTWRKVTPLECERLQNLPDGYTAGISNSQRYKALGNGWTVDVIAHLFSLLTEEGQNKASKRGLGAWFA